MYLYLVSLGSPAGSILEKTEPPRRVHSGPKERTKHIDDNIEAPLGTGTPPIIDSGKR